MTKPRIILLEDQLAQSQSLVALLRRDYEVDAYTDYGLGLGMLRVNAAEPDPTKRYHAAVIDLSFDEEEDPENRGFTLLAEAVKDPFLEAIIHTATGSQQKAARALRLGARAYIEKAKPVEGRTAADLLKDAIASAIVERNRLLSIDQSISAVRIEIAALEHNEPGLAPVTNKLGAIAARIQDTYKAFLTARGRDRRV